MANKKAVQVNLTWINPPQVRIEQIIWYFPNKLKNSNEVKYKPLDLVDDYHNLGRLNQNMIR